MLEINFTILLQILTFLLLVFFLNIILFRPIRKVLAQRKEETDSLQTMIDELQNRSEENEKGIEQNMAQARKEGYVEKENFKGQGLEEEKGILQVASTTVEEKIASARKEMEKKIAKARTGLEDEMTGFSNELAEKILGRAIQ